MNNLRDLFLDALESCGYGVIEAITLWNEIYLPEIKSLPIGKHVYNIGTHEIKFTKQTKESK